MTLSDTLRHLPAFMAKMENAGLQQVVINTFAYYYELAVRGETGLVYDKDILPVDLDDIKDMQDIRQYAESGKKALPKAVMIVLNGGLGTSMGLTRPKSLLEAREGKTFLEIILNQAQRRNLTLAFMNSFNTDEATRKALSAINPPELPLMFLQHKFPKILQEDFAPAVWNENPELEWNPPGHGDIYTALLTSGMLENLLDKGIVYAFICNSDNLGAAMDDALLGYFAENNFPFMMEVAQKTPADVKGGHLARHKDGYLLLREAAQCPDAELEAFKDIERYRFFNTNNLWINLRFLKELFEETGTIRLPMILNPKTLDPRDKNSPRVFQVETAMGAAVSLFSGATAVKVPRTRFFPVKKCSDLLAVRSDRFVFSNENTLILNPNIISDTIRINLDDEYYGKIDQFDERFRNGVPSLTACESLTVKGDVVFGKDVKIRENVVIKNTRQGQGVVGDKMIINKNLEL